MKKSIYDDPEIKAILEGSEERFVAMVKRRHREELERKEREERRRRRLQRLSFGLLGRERAALEQ